MLIAFDDMIADMLSNKKYNPIVNDLFIRGRKLSISLVFLAVLFYCAKKYQTKVYALFYYENSKQMRTSAYCIESFIRY